MFSVLNVKVLVVTFNQEKAIVVGAFSVVVNYSRTFVCDGPTFMLYARVDVCKEQIIYFDGLTGLV